MAEEQVALLILPAVATGLVIGIYEALLLHRDVAVSTHRFGHTIHALVLSILFVFLAMNTEWAIQAFNLSGVQYLNNVWILRAVIGLIAVVKIHGTSAAIRGSSAGASLGLKETWFHSLLIGALIVVSPVLWDKLLKNIAPSWLQ